jgi:dihydroxy-acid dehydratase
VTVDVATRELSVDRSDAAIDDRLAAREEPEPAYSSGVLAKYGRQFGSAADGAVTDPGARK